MKKSEEIKKRLLQLVIHKRKELGLTLEKAAALVGHGYTKQRLSTIEKGEKVSIGRIIDVLEAYDVEIDFIAR